MLCRCFHVKSSKRVHCTRTGAPVWSTVRAVRVFHVLEPFSWVATDVGAVDASLLSLQLLNDSVGEL